MESKKGGRKPRANTPQQPPTVDFSNVPADEDLPILLFEDSGNRRHEYPPRVARRPSTRRTLTNDERIEEAWKKHRAWMSRHYLIPERFRPLVDQPFKPMDPSELARAFLACLKTGPFSSYVQESALRRFQRKAEQAVSKGDLPSTPLNGQTLARPADFAVWLAESNEELAEPETEPSLPKELPRAFGNLLGPQIAAAQIEEEKQHLPEYWLSSLMRYFFLRWCDKSANSRPDFEETEQSATPLAPAEDGWTMTETATAPPASLKPGTIEAARKVRSEEAKVTRKALADDFCRYRKRHPQISKNEAAKRVARKWNEDDVQAGRSVSYKTVERAAKEHNAWK